MKSATHIILAAVVLLTASLLISAQTAETSQNPPAQNSQAQAPQSQAPPSQSPAPPNPPSQGQPPQAAPAPPPAQNPPSANPGTPTTPPQTPPAESVPAQPSQPPIPAPVTSPPPPPYTPKFPGDPARSESEAQALGYMRVVLRAQQLYKKRHEKYAASLADLAGTGSFTRRMAKTTERGDYTVGFRSRKDGFILVMTPKQMDEQHRSFYAEEDAVIHADDQKAADATSPRIK